MPVNLQRLNPLIAILAPLLNILILGCTSNAQIAEKTTKGPNIDFNATGYLDYKLHEDCFNYQVKKYTSYDERHSIYVIPQTIKKDNFGLYADMCLGKFRFKILFPCRSKEGVYWLQESGKYALQPSPWTERSAAAETLCDIHFF